MPTAHSGLPWQIASQVQNVNTATTSTTAHHEQSSLHEQFQTQSDHHAEMLLSPAALGVGT